MAKGEGDIYTGELSLPKGTKFDIKILKSTVSTTSGGNNTWSAIKYESTLNLSASHDFGEFTDNLIPNGNFDEGPVKWTPSDLIVYRDTANSTPYMAFVGGTVAASCTSDAFTIMPVGFEASFKQRYSGLSTCRRNVGLCYRTTLLANNIGEWASIRSRLSARKRSHWKNIPHAKHAIWLCLMWGILIWENVS